MSIPTKAAPEAPGAGPQLYRRARGRIPGGTQLLSKRAEMFLPDWWPAYYSRAKGVEVTDLDGRVYTDMSIMGVGACVLGYADDDVDAAARRAIEHGVMCTLNAPEEVELADLLCELHPWAAMVRYARSGGEAMALAVRIARAHTGRDAVAVCGYHGWMDWYLAANLGETHALDGHLMPGLPPSGVPRGLCGSALAFHYNRADQLEQIVAGHGHELAAIVMEPQRGDAPAPGFLEAVRRLADTTGAVLIFDEITTGFRMCAGGVHLLHGVGPDLAVFAKAMANGYAMAAVIGVRPVMESAQATFISSTNWTERIGPSAALAAVKKYRERAVEKHLIRIGSRVQQGWRDSAASAGLPLKVGGLPSLAHFEIDHAERGALTTLFTQTMLDQGFLAYNQFKPSLAHTDQHVDDYLALVSPAFDLLRSAIDKGDVTTRLRGQPARSGFYRLTS